MSKNTVVIEPDFGKYSRIEIEPLDKKPKLPRGKEWVAALRSGEYRQGTGGLVRNLKHCCLGVLCEVQGWNNISETRGSGYLSILNPLNEFIGTHGNIPCKSFATFTRQGNVKETYETKLAYLNDDGVSFATIADIIESVFELE